jgi:hypothetical protein
MELVGIHLLHYPALDKMRKMPIRAPVIAA